MLYFEGFDYIIRRRNTHILLVLKENKKINLQKNLLLIYYFKLLIVSIRNFGGQIKNLIHLKHFYGCEKNIELIS